MLNPFSWHFFNPAVLASGGIPGGDSDVARSMTAAEFDTETTNGTAQGPNGYTVIKLEDDVYWCVWDGAAWRYYCGDLLCTLPVNGDFSSLNSPTIDATKKSVLLTIAVGAGAGLRGRMKTAPSTPYHVEVGLMAYGVGVDYMRFGAGFRASGSQESRIWNVVLGAGTTLLRLDAYNSSNIAAGSAGSTTEHGCLYGGGLFLIRIGDDGTTNRTNDISADGLSWVEQFAEGRTVGITANQVLWGASQEDTTRAFKLRLVHWKETA